jgi:phage anti-repressor protein
MNIKKATSKKLIVEAQRLYDCIENKGGFSAWDMLVLESIRDELQRRGYTERLTITFVS